MTTTVSVLPKGQVELPAEFRRRKKIKPGTTLRVTEIGEGLYVTPMTEPTEKELRGVIAAAGSLTRRQSSEEEEMVQQLIAEYREGERRKFWPRLSRILRRTMKTISQGIKGIRLPAPPRIRPGQKPMSARQLIRWLKSQGAIPTPPEMKRRLKAAGHSGMPIEDNGFHGR